MKDLFDFNEHSEAAKNELLLQMMVNGNSMSQGRADDLGYEYFEKLFGEEEMRCSVLVWYEFSERIYSELEREGLVWVEKKWMHLTDEGEKAVRLTYTKYVFRKKVDEAFRLWERFAGFIKSLSNAWRWLAFIASLLASSIIYLTSLL